MAVIILGLVAYLERFGLYGKKMARANAKKAKKRKKQQSLSRGEKVKSTMKLDGHERRETTSTATFIGLNCFKIHFGFGFKWHRAEKKERLKMLIFALKLIFFC